MHFLAGTLIVLAIIYFMIVSPGFRAFAIILLLVCGVGIWLIVENNQKQTLLSQQQRAEEQRQQAENQRKALAAIRPEELLLSGVTLTKDSYSGWLLKGTVTNNSKFDLGQLTFIVTIQDCPQQCRIIGQERVSTSSGSSYSSDRKVLVPAGQARLFQTYHMKFENLPPATASQWDYKIIEVRAVF